MLPESLGVYVTGKNAIEIEIHKSYNTLTPTWTSQKHYLIPSLTGGDALDINDAFDVIQVYGNEYEAYHLCCYCPLRLCERHMLSSTLMF